jgi:PIN domain nuclease of toxin-antitoxin system
VTTHLLDTNAWLRRVSHPGQIHPRAQVVLDAAESAPLALSAISVWEIALKYHKGKLDLTLSPDAWIKLALPPGLVEVIPIDATIVLRSTELPGDFHSDPADRFIVATALLRGLTVVTSDERILAYPPRSFPRYPVSKGNAWSLARNAGARGKLIVTMYAVSRRIDDCGRDKNQPQLSRFRRLIRRHATNH